MTWPLRKFTATHISLDFHILSFTILHAKAQSHIFGYPELLILAEELLKHWQELLKHSFQPLASTSHWLKETHPPWHWLPWQERPGTFFWGQTSQLEILVLTIDRPRRAMGRKRLQQNASGGKLSLEWELAGVKGSFYVEKKELFGYMQQIRVHTTYVILLWDILVRSCSHATFPSEFSTYI